MQIGLIKRTSLRIPTLVRIMETPINYIAFSPVSPVLILTASSTGVTKIFPSPILPVLALCLIASTTLLTSSSGMTTSNLIFGRKSTTYSAPRYRSVCPFCLPKPFTSLTVRPLSFVLFG